MTPQIETPQNIHKQAGYVENVATDAVPFVDAEEAWFWFLQAQAARYDGARFTSGQALYPRPCEPIDVFKVVDRLYRNRMITMEHLRVLKHYGQRLMAPDANRTREARAHSLWVEALDKIEDVLVNKGIVQRIPDQRFSQQMAHYAQEGTVQ